MLVEELSQSLSLFGLGMGTVFVLLAMLIACVTAMSKLCLFLADKESVALDANDEKDVNNKKNIEQNEQIENIAQFEQIEAPLSSTLIEVCFTQGDYVNKGDVVVRLEAMKMETEVRAKCSGNLSEIYFNVGDNVEAGQTILSLSADVKKSVNNSKKSLAGSVKNGDNSNANKEDVKTITAPLSANVVDVCVSLNQSVEEGDVIAILEAMKMETEIRADSSGNVSDIHIKQGDSINAGQLIVTLN